MWIQCRLESSLKLEVGGGKISLGSMVNFTGTGGDNEVWLSGDGVKYVVID